jgi:hypothetical protein
MKAVRDGAVFSVVGAMPSTFSSARLGRAKKHRAMPYAICLIQGYFKGIRRFSIDRIVPTGNGGTPIIGNASR